MKGKNGEAYNVADENSDIRLKDLAELIARICNVNVVFEAPNSVELAGYSKATKSRLDSSKLQNLGWRANYSIETGLLRTINCLDNSDMRSD